jgi:uncharacterized membrane protein YdbT with pleckstrin-like domain
VQKWVLNARLGWFLKLLRELLTGIVSYSRVPLASRAVRDHAGEILRVVFSENIAVKKQKQIVRFWTWRLLRRSDLSTILAITKSSSFAEPL